MQKDESKARSLLQVAADRGDQDAAQLLSVLDSQGGGELQKTPASSPEPTPQELAERRRKIEYAEAQAQALLREEAELAEKENNTQKPKKKKKKKGKTQAPADDAPPTNLNVPMRPMRPSAMPGFERRPIFYLASRGGVLVREPHARHDVCSRRWRGGRDTVDGHSPPDPRGSRVDGVTRRRHRRDGVLVGHHAVERTHTHTRTKVTTHAKRRPPPRREDFRNKRRR